MAPQVKGMKVRFEQDPNNPHAPPRRIIEKAGFWERLVGVKNEQVRPSALLRESP
jgi:hypothetical protein